ncbi:class I SAM-dependent methyltransferase [Kibdelosporangium philippinense]|uniref:Class I SAM-dependent methyltransferase n=1 Tax=Kibdelosporangium philippinense TaxID=211113 RepID=A0ABS8ZJE6_9PSEU|nr:class I SAM-dependent methyltransferase [Kibdelosporangium philippinense]MCE7007935.1 class I SAM-dependent methyltransferase [Kibdelosporangium philippinense]
MTADPAVSDPAGLPLTGERTVPGIAEENYWFRRHEAAYITLSSYCRDAIVLEAGCGEGYGADLLAQDAKAVIGLDYDVLTTEHVARKYPRVAMLRGNLVMLPFASGSIDVVANLQVIEHLWEQERFLAECSRVLRPGGRLLITTPNRITFSPGRDTPLNPFHTRELSGSELTELLVGAGFTVELMAGLRHGPALREADARFGSIIRAQMDVAVSGGPWPADLLTAVEAVTSADFEIVEADVDASLDLVGVAIKP